jgi:hypothetical protein
VAGLRFTGDHRTRALRRRRVSKGGKRQTMTEGMNSGLMGATDELGQARWHRATRGITCEWLLSRARVAHDSDMSQQRTSRR